MFVIRSKIAIECIALCMYNAIWQNPIVKLPKKKWTQLRHTPAKRYIKKTRKWRKRVQEEIKYFHLIYVLKVTQLHTLTILYPIKFKWNQITIFLILVCVCVCSSCICYIVCFMNCVLLWRWLCNELFIHIYFVWIWAEVERWWRGEIAITEKHTHTRKKWLADGMEKRDTHTHTYYGGANQKCSIATFEKPIHISMHIKWLPFAASLCGERALNSGGNSRFASVASQQFLMMW